MNSEIGAESRAQLSELSLAIVCPMANELSTASRFVEELLGETSCFREVLLFVVLDNASTDGTLALLREMAQRERRLRVIFAPENRSAVDAYIRGYREAVATGFDWVLEIDAGFSHKPSDLRNFLPHLGEGNDCVFGSRFCPGGRISDSSLRRHVLSKIGTVVSNAMLGTRLSDMTSGYQMFDRRVLEAILERGIRSRSPFFQTEMKAYCHGLQIVEAPIHYRFASHHITSRAIGDSLGVLMALFRMRLAGTLFVNVSRGGPGIPAPPQPSRSATGRTNRSRVSPGMQPPI